MPFPWARSTLPGPSSTRLRKRLPGCCLIVSATTEQGFRAAVNNLGAKATCIHAPLDFTGAVKRALATLQPDILVCLETEIWPNWLTAAHERGIKIASCKRSDFHAHHQPLYKDPTVDPVDIDPCGCIQHDSTSRCRPDSSAGGCRGPDNGKRQCQIRCFTKKKPIGH